MCGLKNFYSLINISVQRSLTWMIYELFLLYLEKNNTKMMVKSKFGEKKVVINCSFEKKSLI